MSDIREGWSENNRLRMMISPSGSLILLEQEEDGGRVTRLDGKEVLNLFDFLLGNLREIKRRQRAANQP